MALVISVVARREEQVNRVLEGGVVPDGCIISSGERQDHKNKLVGGKATPQEQNLSTTTSYSYSRGRGTLDIG